MKTIRLLMTVCVLVTACFSLHAKAKTERLDIESVSSAWNVIPDSLFLYQQPLEQQWWLRFNDATLNTLVDEVLKNNYDLKQAAYRVDQAKAAMRVAQGGFYPTININAGYDYNQNVTVPGATSHVGSLGVDAQWEIDIIGAVRNRAKSQKASYLATQEEYNAVMTALVAQTVQTYVQLRCSQWRLQVVEHNLQSQKETMEITEARFNTGLASALDVAQAKSIYYATESQVPSMETTISEYINQMGILLGKVPWSVKEQLALPQDATELNPNMLVSVGIPAQVLRQRPDVRAAEKSIDAKAAMVGARVADWLPRFYVTGKFGYASQDFQDLFNGNNMYWQVAPSMQWNIFSGTTLTGNIQSAKAALEEAVNSYNNTVLTALQEVDNAMTHYHHATTQVEAVQKAFEQAQITNKLAIDLYKKGLTDFQNVLDAQRSLLQYEDDLVEAKSSVSLALVQLYRALGGEWNNEQ
ncbi:MAG: efflux transporter outer membrane subunit [Paludibacteraceae bacterium]|jgi:NodT family efflux transporter outer membrane factor (OMF) lipoprotein|nr:efflux transporter outer membrane subunit [Paludibacteraceae bacterium]